MNTSLTFESPTTELLVRISITLLSLGAWFLSQRWIDRRNSSRKEKFHDSIHHWTQSLNKRLQSSPKLVNALLISSSLAIDGVTVFIMANSILGSSFRPFAGLLVLFLFRQISQSLVTLPIPPGMIWRSPGFPSLFVTYGVSNDLFFSGHTALAVYGALEIARMNSHLALAAGVVLAVYEIGVVLLLRAHWTVDVIAGLFAALWVHSFMGL